MDPVFPNNKDSRRPRPQSDTRRLSNECSRQAQSPPGIARRSSIHWLQCKGKSGHIGSGKGEKMAAVAPDYRSPDFQWEALGGKAILTTRPRPLGAAESSGPTEQGTQRGRPPNPHSVNPTQNQTGLQELGEVPRFSFDFCEDNQDIAAPEICGGIGRFLSSGSVYAWKEQGS